MAAVYRPAALFLTNKENFVAGSGDFAGTQINSSNMLWSLSGSLGLVYKILFGMRYEADQLVFQPFVPQAFAGQRTLMGLRYRRAVLGRGGAGLRQRNQDDYARRAAAGWGRRAGQPHRPSPGAYRVERPGSRRARQPGSQPL